LIWRIRERNVFARLSRDGVRTRAGVLWCTFLLDPLQSPPRVGFAIGRAVGPAVIRNQVRRRLRVLLSAADLPPGNYLVGARPAAAGRSSAELQRDVQALASGVARTLSATGTTNTRSASAPGSSSDSC
jgi:ribonuclease P protein component